MSKYEVIEGGNGYWCDPIEATNMQAALEVVKANLRDSSPADYVDEYEPGDALPTVDVTIRDVDTGEGITRTLTVGIMPDYIYELHDDQGKIKSRHYDYDAAVAAAEEYAGFDGVVGHDGDLSCGGDKTLIWGDEESAEGDAGENAIGSIRRV